MENNNLVVVLVGLQISKENATALGIKIYAEVLESLIIKNMRAKFTHSFIKEIVNDYLKKPEILDLIAQEYKIKPLISYKLESQIQAQISKGYFNGQDGVICLIKNTKVGKAGKGTKYCTIEEAKEAKLTIEDLDLEKLWNELTPFIDNATIPKIEKARKEPKLKVERGCKTSIFGDLSELESIIIDKTTKDISLKIDNLTQPIENKEVKAFYEE